MNDTIKYLSRPEIDSERWDHCVRGSGNGVMYALSYYLDHVTRNWGAVVLNDYQSVMPVAWNRKWWISYVYDAPFVQRLGIFGEPIDEDTKKIFLKTVTDRFPYVDACFDFAVDHYDVGVRKRNNFLIQLNQSYADIKSGYTDECRSNIRKAVARGCSFDKEVPVAEVIALYRKVYGHFHTSLKSREYRQLEKLSAEAAVRGQLRSSGVRLAATGELIFGALLFNCGKRLYYLLAAPTAAGRKARAAYYYIDQLMQRYCGTGLIFDFEGSDVPDVAAFYRRFGPETERYYHLHVNRLHWFVKLFKS